jgi:hypothetical protein
MMRLRLAILALVLASGCNKPAPSTSSPTPTEPSRPTPTEPADGSAGCGAPNQGTAMTPEQCTCLGGRVNASRGGEQEHCAADERELGDVRFGIEGGWCCKAP